MDQAGVVLENEDKVDEGSIMPEETKPDSYDQYSVKALTQMLDDVLESEDYEKAAKIRDEINKRKEKE